MQNGLLSFFSVNRYVLISLTIISLVANSCEADIKICKFDTRRRKCTWLTFLSLSVAATYFLSNGSNREQDAQVYLKKIKLLSEGLFFLDAR